MLAACRRLLIFWSLPDSLVKARTIIASSRFQTGLWRLESTGSYRKPLYNILEASGHAAMVVNAQHMKVVPGRKMVVKDSEWIADQTV